MKRYFIWKGIKIGLFVTAGIFLFGWLFMLLWNALVPELFSGPVLNYWEAIGVLVLAKILFGGWKGSHWGRHGCCCYGGGHYGKHHWKEKMEARMANMSEEEREKMKEKFRKCGWE